MIAVLVVIADQLTKYIVRSHIRIDETFMLWGIEFTRIENSGMAGGMLQGYGRLFGVAAVLFVGMVLCMRRKGEIKGALLESGFGFLVGGAVGNGADRLLFGQVTDFIVRGRGVLNIADHAIEAGVLLLILSVLKSALQRRQSP